VASSRASAPSPPGHPAPTPGSAALSNPWLSIAPRAVLPRFGKGRSAPLRAPLARHSQHRLHTNGMQEGHMRL